MTQRFWDRLNTKIGNKYLDIAERLPKIDNGFISRLQFIRKDQRRESERVLKEGRPPKNVTIDSFGIQLFEAFDLSNFNNLETGLMKLFQGGHTFLTRLDDIKQGKGSLTGSGWFSIGSIVKNNNRTVQPFAVLPSLPEFIDYIQLKLHRILPSQYIISLDVYFNKSIAEQFNDITSNLYLPKMKFHSLLPWTMLKEGPTQYPSESVAEEELTKWINSLRYSIEECICPFLSGSFTKSYYKDKVKLPCINWFILKDDEKTKISLSDWLVRHKWLRSIGFREAITNISHKSSKYIFSKPYTGKNTIPPFVVIALENDILNEIDLKGMYGNDKINAICCDTGNLKTELTKVLSIIFLLQLIKRELENTRVKIVEILKHKCFRKFNKVLDVNSSLQSISTKIHELNNEFNKDKIFIKHELNELASVKNRFDNNGNLKEDVFNIIEALLETLLGTLKVSEKSFSDYINNTNIKIMFKLQSRIFWLTIVAIIVTIIATITSIIINQDKFFDSLSSILGN